MIRLITAGACALFLLGCATDAPADGGNSPAAGVTSVAVNTSAKFELGKDI